MLPILSYVCSREVGTVNASVDEAAQLHRGFLK